MRLYVPILCLLLVQYCSVASADEDNSSGSGASDFLDTVWQGIVRVKDIVEPHVRYAAGRTKAFAVGEPGSRSARTTNVTIINRTGKSFSLTRDHCNVGKFSERMLPPQIINPTSQVVYGTESTTIGRGNACEVKYASRDGAWFSLETKNPFLKSNSMKADPSPELKVEQDLGGGLNNEVTLTVSSAF